MQAVAIINPVAGASRKRAEFRAMLARLRVAGIDVESCTTAGGGDAKRIAARVAAEARMAGPDDAAAPARAVIAVGGDGTIREVVDGLTGSTVPMVVWPTGTENLLAKSFGFRPDPEVTLACLTAGRTVPLDLGSANGQSFHTVAGVGFDAEVVDRLVRMRKGHITHLSYADPLWRTFWEHRFPRVRVLSEERVLWEGEGMVFVGNLPRYSLGLRIVRDARYDDGLLDVCIFPCGGRLRLIAHSLRALARKHIGRGGVFYTRLREVRIESDGPVPVELDGEAAGTLPIDVTVRPAAIRLRTPPA